jgi:hypothetical protein
MQENPPGRCRGGFFVEKEMGMEFVAIVGIIGLVAIVAIVHRTRFVGKADGQKVEMQVAPEKKE